MNQNMYNSKLSFLIARSWAKTVGQLKLRLSERLSGLE